MSFFLGVMRSDVAEPRLRLEAGKAAATYLYKKPSENAPGDAAKLIEAAPVADGGWTEAHAQRKADLRQWLDGAQRSDPQYREREVEWWELHRRWRAETVEGQAEDAERKALGL
jgi:hypothetical protein